MRWIGQTLGVDGSRKAENLNNNYFENGRHTPLMIMIKGGTLTDESFDKLQQYMNDIKGEAGQHAFINTYVEYDGATAVVGAKTHEEAVAAIKNGEFFFSVSEESKVVVEYDINSLVSFKDGKDKSYRKNRVIRVFDTFGEALQLNFPPNKYDNDPDGWDIMEGIGRSLLKKFRDAGAIKNVDLDNDFLVDRELSEGDETYFNVGLEPVDSSEKIYFTVTTR